MTDIRDIFILDVNRSIEPVVKVDQDDPSVVRAEIDEYVVTASIDESLHRVLEGYQEAQQKPGESVAVWVSGFFGSGKSSFAKFLGFALGNSDLNGKSATDLLADRVASDRTRVLLHQIAESIPTDSVILDIASDRLVKTANQSVVEILYVQLLGHLGYATHLDLAELEISLEADGELQNFKTAFHALTEHDWDQRKHVVARAITEASATMHAMKPHIYADKNSWYEGARDQADISAATLATRATELMDGRGEGRNLVFVVDEVGQYISRDVQKMLDMQAVVEQLGIAGRGRLWIVVTAQEKLGEVVSGLDDRRIELARLQDRFPFRVHLEPSDISEVTSKRVLRKSAAGERELGNLYDRHHGALGENTALNTDVQFPGLSRQAFIDLYPLLPYQVEMIIDIVSGLRTRGGAGRHVGGANRTIVKLAQQILVNPAAGVQNKPVGTLVRADQIFDLVRDDVGGDMRGKIDSVAAHANHPLAEQVAKAVCLLEFVPTIPRTRENIAAVLHPEVHARSVLAETREALDQLVAAQLVREDDGQFRIPTPREDNWEKQRISLMPTPGDTRRALCRVLSELWTPVPAHDLDGVRSFKAGMSVDGQSVVTEGDLVFHLYSFPANENGADARTDAQNRSRQDDGAVFWVFGLTPEIDAWLVDFCRSDEMIKRSSGASQTREESDLVRSEKRRFDQLQSHLRSALTDALLTGSAFHGGNDRSIHGSTVGAAASGLLESVLPTVFSRHSDAAARPTRADFDALASAERLDGLPPIFSHLGLLTTQGGTTTVNIDAPALAAALSRIRERFAAGDADTGKSLMAHFESRPFGWAPDVTRLLVATLLRAGAITLQSSNQIIASLTAPEGRTAISNANTFKASRLQPRASSVGQGDIIDAARNAEEVFGSAPAGLDLTAVAAHIREAATQVEETVQAAITAIRDVALLGNDQISQAAETLRLLRTTKNDEEVIVAFNGSAVALHDGITTSAAVAHSLDQASVRETILAGQRALDRYTRDLSVREGTRADIHASATQLEEALARPSFYDHVAEIRALGVTLGTECDTARDEAIKVCRGAYEKALKSLESAPGFLDIEANDRARIAGALADGQSDPAENASLGEIELRTNACAQVLNDALAQLAALTAEEAPVTVRLAAIAPGAVETPDDLEATLAALRVACLEHIALGRTVLIQ